MSDPYPSEEPQDSQTPGVSTREQSEPVQHDQQARPPEGDADPQQGTTQSAADVPVPDPVSTPPALPKRSPAEAFAEMTDVLANLRADIQHAMEYTKKTHTVVQRIDQDRQAIEFTALDALFRVHNLAFRHVQLGERDKDDAGFTVMLLQLLEGEFKTLGVEIVLPLQGEVADYSIMEAIGTARCRFWQKPGRVAQTESCGFVVRTPAGARVLHKAKVVLFSREERAQ